MHQLLYSMDGGACSGCADLWAIQPSSSRRRLVQQDFRTMADAEANDGNSGVGQYCLKPVEL
jgi:hypothetical protein